MKVPEVRLLPAREFPMDEEARTAFRQRFRERFEGDPSRSQVYKDVSKGIPTAGLLAQVLVAKYSDHLPLYRQERIFGRAGVEIPRSTLAQWVGICGVRLQPLVDALKAEIFKHAVLHADETPVAMLKPGNKKTHKACPQASHLVLARHWEHTSGWC